MRERADAKKAAQATEGLGRKQTVAKMLAGEEKRMTESQVASMSVSE